MIRRHPPKNDPDALARWYESLACAWVYYAGDYAPELAAIDYEHTLGAQSVDTSSRPGDADRGAVVDLDNRLFVSRLVDRMRTYAGEAAFRAFVAYHSTPESYAEVAGALSVSPSTARRLVAKAEATILSLYHGDTVESYLSPDERWAWIPNTDQRYLVTTEGRVFSLVRGSPEELSLDTQHRVSLRSNSRTYRPRVPALVEQVFGAHVRARLSLE